MKVFRIFIFSLFFSLLVYFSIHVIQRGEPRNVVFDKKVIFINSGVGKKGYICTDGMENITSLVIEGFNYDPPVEIKPGGLMMGNEDLTTMEGALKAILTAKATNNREWEYTMTEYYYMTELKKIRKNLTKDVLDMLNREDAKYGKYKLITMDLRVKIGNNILCVLRCYDVNDQHEIRSIVLRDIGGQYFQMKLRTKRERIQKLYVLSSYASGIYRQIVEEPQKGLPDLF
ncbi:MAG: hypothetical protein JW928_09355 [Candidatus Aureabacteria bacterium]|nr:hypothetical protein [Candidatus Auribacterota bacterium]